MQQLQTVRLFRPLRASHHHCVTVFLLQVYCQHHNHASNNARVSQLAQRGDLLPRICVLQAIAVGQQPQCCSSPKYKIAYTFVHDAIGIVCNFVKSSSGWFRVPRSRSLHWRSVLCDYIYNSFIRASYHIPTGVAMVALDGSGHTVRPVPRACVQSLLSKL